MHIHIYKVELKSRYGIRIINIVSTRTIVSMPNFSKVPTKIIYKHNKHSLYMYLLHHSRHKLERNTELFSSTASHEIDR